MSHQEHQHDHEHCSCGQSHEKHHHESCGCGLKHNHEHQHNDHNECCCGHGHEHHEHPVSAVPVTHTKGSVRKLYRLNNLGCANCAAKMERKINELPGVEEATITFATAQLCVWAKDPDSLLPEYQAICASIESQVTVTPFSSSPKNAQQEDERPSLKPILAGAALFIIARVLEGILPALAPLSIHPVILAIYIFTYLLLGHEVLQEAFENIRKGQVFDENFLMSVATICAFLIGEYAEAVGVMLFFQVGEYFEAVAVEKSRSNIMEAMDLRPEVVHLVQSEGTVVTIPAEEAVVGDIIEIRPGDRVPLDGTILEGESLLDTSPVTGEPVPVSVGSGSEILSGCVNTNGLLRLRVDQPLETSMVTRILESVENAAASKPQIDRFITRFSRVYTPIVVALAAAVAVVPSIVTGDVMYWVKTACTFLVISCPCALVLSVPLAFFAGIGRASQEKILFKGGSALEAIAKVKAVVLDKTGTITEGNFKLQQVIPTEGISEAELLSIAAGCEAHSTHPIAQSICAAAAERGLTPLSCAHIQERSGKGVEADGILCGNLALLESFGIAVPQLAHTMGTQVLLAKEGRFLGQLVISDTVKAGAEKAVDSLHAMGLGTAILTGDSEESAGDVANAVGIQKVRAKLLPQEKLTALRELRGELGPVLFVGDGINDAPVLAGADVGAAMGSGADTAIEAADLVFLTSDLSAIRKSVEIGRSAVSIAKQNVVLALVIKLAVIVMGFFGFANMWAAVFADTGVAMLCILNSVRTLYRK